MMRWPTLVFAAVSFFGCTHPAGGTDNPSPSSEAPSVQEPHEARGARREIAAFVTRDVKITIVSGADLRVVVRKLDGTLVADMLTLDELAERHPELDAVVRSAVASNASGTYLDARGPQSSHSSPRAAAHAD